MKDEDYQQLVEKLKKKYFLIESITKDYKFKIKDKKYSSILAYNVSYSLELSAQLVIFENDIDINYIFEQTDFKCVILLKNDKNEIYIRKGLDKFKEINKWPTISQLLWLSTKNFFLFFICFFSKMIELVLAQILTAILKTLIPPFGNKLWEYYSNPLHRVFRKRDVDKVV